MPPRNRQTLVVQRTRKQKQGDAHLKHPEKVKSTITVETAPRG